MNVNPSGIDGKSITSSVAKIIDTIKYRKYAKEGYTTVIWINKENTLVKLVDGRIRDALLTIPSQNAEKMIDKVYILPSKKLVTRLCFVKEDVNVTLDVNVTDTSKISTDLFKKFVNIKLLEDLQAFNMGQVLLGGAIGLIFGFMLALGLLMFYGVMVGV
jgi:hypothetical protein